MEEELDFDPEVWDLINNMSELCSIVKEFRKAEDFQVLKSSKTYAPFHFDYCIDKKTQQNVSTVIRKDADWDLKGLLSEIKFVSKLNHSNILKFYENYASLDETKIGFVYEGHACLLSEVIETDAQIVYRPEVIKHIMKELFTALDYLHKNHVVHRDIQPENIALTYSGNFQHAQTVGEPLVDMKDCHFRYQPLESILQEGTVHPSLDIWSANVIFGELWLKTSLFPTAGKECMVAGIFSLLGFPTMTTWKSFFRFRDVETLMGYSPYVLNLLEVTFGIEMSSGKMSPQCWRLLERNFRYFPRKRLSAEKCLVHEYFSEEPLACGSDLLETLSLLTDVRRAKNLVKQEIALLKAMPLK